VSAAGRGERIALLHPFHWSEVHRGTERLLSQLAAGLVADGYAPALITTHRGPRSRTREDGLEVIRNRRPPRLLPADRRHQLSHIPFTRRALRRGRYDLAHAFHPSDALAATAWGRRSGRPALFTAPASPPGDAGKLRAATLRRLFERIQMVAATSEAAAAEIRLRFPAATVRVVYPGTDLGYFTPGGERAADPTILCAAAIEEPRKRVELVVRAHSLLRKSLPEARLLLCDPYPGRTLPAWADAPGVEVRPIHSDDDLLRTYREAWVSVLAATREPFGMVLVESLACGTPVVGAREGGITEIIRAEGEIGAKFDGGAEELAERLGEWLLRPPEPALAERCRLHAGEFSAQRSVAAYEALYEELLSGPPRLAG
jgi:phosphatidyl-myo-inositol alpha-mannosyltransferase